MRRLFVAAVLAMCLAVAATASADGSKMCAVAFEDGQMYAQRGKLIVARETLAACAKPECPAQLRADCNAKRDEVERGLPTVTFVVRDADGKDVANPALFIDGVSFDAAGHAAPIDPGEHAVSFARSGSDTHEERIAIREGEKDRLVILSLGATPASATGPPPRAPARGPAAPPPTGSGVGPYILIIGGTLLVLAGGTYQMLALVVNGDASDIDRRRNSDPATNCRDPANARLIVTSATCADLNAAYDTKKSAAKNDQALAIVASSLGIGALVGGIAWLVVAKPRPESRAVVLPEVGPHSAGLTVGARF